LEKNQYYTITVLMLIGLVCFVGIFDRDLWTPDEPRVAAKSLEIAETGNWIVLHLAGRPFVEKPPLYHASVAAAIRLTGDRSRIAGTARFVTALWGIGVLLFAGLTARRLFGPTSGLVTAAVLATMVGFVENFHWIRPDAALSFFVMACVWCLVEIFYTDRPVLYLPAGLFAAGAFLSKGFIGPILIGIAFSGLIAASFLCKTGKKLRPRHLIWLITGLLIFGVLSGTWVGMFRSRVDDATWNEWLVTNHFGRFTGEAVHKGHLHPGSYGYYLLTVLIYSFPWTLFLFVHLYQIVRQFKAYSRDTKKTTLFLLIWAIGTLVLLTIPVTKRDIYFLPVLPAYAMLAAQYIKNSNVRWVRQCTGWIASLCVVLLIIFTVSPWAMRPFLNKIPAGLHDAVTQPGSGQAICLAGVLLCVYAIVWFRQQRVTPFFCIFLCMAMLYTGLFAVPMTVIDQHKNLRIGTEDFLSRIPVEERPEIAGWNFSQTTLASFYIYADWKVPQLESEDDVNRVLSGAVPEYSSVVLNQIHAISDVVSEPYELLHEGYPRGTRTYRGLFWISGQSIQKSSDDDLFFNHASDFME
jgi:4-amino-4-deoxy-L-arabinose transferase-like glycosyltransferase